MNTALYSITHVGPLRLALLALVLALAGMFLATVVHGIGANEGYDIAKQELGAQHTAELAAITAAYDREMADAYMDNAVLRERLQDYQMRASTWREEAEQAKAERDWYRSRLGMYERVWEPPIDAYATARPGTETSQIQGAR